MVICLVDLTDREAGKGDDKEEDDDWSKEVDDLWRDGEDVAGDEMTQSLEDVIKDEYELFLERRHDRVRLTESVSVK